MCVRAFMCSCMLYVHVIVFDTIYAYIAYTSFLSLSTTSAAGQWLKYRGHLDNISNNMFIR